MAASPTLPEAFLALPRYGPLGAPDRVRAATRGLGLPTLGAKITGSNGKGSTSHLVAWGLAARGLRVGLYISPHMLDPGERVQVLSGGVSVPAPAEALWPRVAQAAREGAATRFEAFTVGAARYFAEQALDAVVWEAGIGGRHDATRAFDSPVTVLTQVALEHTAVLGDTLEAIADDKAALVTPGGVLITGPLNDPLMRVIRATAERVIRVDAPARTGLPGAHQGWNAACARAAITELVGWSEASQAAFDAVRVPGRFERVPRRDAGELWVDAAHNVSGMAVAVATARARWGDGWLPIFGASADREVEAMAEALAGCGEVVATTAHHKGAPVERVVAAGRAAGLRVYEAPSPREAVSAALERAGTRPVLALGGLFLAAEILADAQGRDGAALIWF